MRILAGKERKNCQAAETEECKDLRLESNFFFSTLQFVFFSSQKGLWWDTPFDEKESSWERKLDHVNELLSPLISWKESEVCGKMPGESNS